MNKTQITIERQHMANLITMTLDGTPVFWGYKQSDDPTSNPITLWVALGNPLPDGSNYFRIPSNLEIEYMNPAFELSSEILGKIAESIEKNLHWSHTNFILHKARLEHAISKLTSNEIRDKWATA